MFDLVIDRELPRPVGDDDPMARLWDEWDRKRAGAIALRREEFDPFAIPELVGRINIVTIEEGRPTRFTFRLFGSGMDDPFESEMTMRSVGDISEPNYADLVQRSYLQVFRLKRPFFAEIKADIGNGDLFHYCRLVLPMSSDRGTYDTLLVASLRYADDYHVRDSPSKIGQLDGFRYPEVTPDAAHRWSESIQLSCSWPQYP